MRNAIRIIGAAAAAAALFWFAVLPYRGNLAVREITERSALARQSEPGRAAIMARENLDMLERIERTSRLAPAWYMLYAANCELLGRYQDAADAYTRALRIDDRPELYVNRGIARLNLGQNDAAMADFVTAARFNPAVLDQLHGDLKVRVAAAAGLQ